MEAPACPPWVEICSWQTQREQSSLPSLLNASLASSGRLSRSHTHTHTHTVDPHPRGVFTPSWGHKCVRRTTSAHWRRVQHVCLEKPGRESIPSNPASSLSPSLCFFVSLSLSRHLCESFLAAFNPDDHSCQWVKTSSSCQVAEAPPEPERPRE